MILALLAVSPAHAIELRWWGVGPNIGTMAIPGSYPTALPINAKDPDTKDPLVTKVKGDVELGVRGVIYPTSTGRVGARGLLGFGTAGFNRQELTVEYDYAFVQAGDFQLLFGAGIGAGVERFPSTAESDTALLRVNYFPIRAQLAGLLRDRTRAYELALNGTFHIVGDNSWLDEPGDPDPKTAADMDVLVAGASYFALGAEATVWFGDFRSKQKASGKKSGSSSRKSSGGSSGGSSGKRRVGGG